MIAEKNVDDRFYRFNDKYLFKIEYRKKEGYAYPEPEETLNGKTFYEYDADSYERKNWHVFYWDHNTRKRVVEICNFDSKYWKEEYKQQIFDLFYKYETDRVSNLRSDPVSTTALFPFEIFLICEGWQLITMGGVNINSSRIYAKDRFHIKVEYEVWGYNNQYIKFGVSCTKENKFLSLEPFHHLPKDNFEEFCVNLMNPKAVGK